MTFFNLYREVMYLQLLCNSSCSDRQKMFGDLWFQASNSWNRRKAIKAWRRYYIDKGLLEPRKQSKTVEHLNCTEMFYY